MRPPKGKCRSFVRRAGHQTAEPGIAVDLEQAAEAFQMARRILAFAVPPYTENPSENTSRRWRISAGSSSALTLNQLENIADNAAALMRQDIAEDAPFCATRLPGGQRVQIVRPPAVPEGRYAMAIRRPSAKAATIQQLVDNGVFSEVRSAERVRAQPRPIVRELLALKAAQRWPELIALAIRNGFNVVWAGMVGTGKTDDLRAFLEAIPMDWRIVTVEDMEEIM